MSQLYPVLETGKEKHLMAQYNRGNMIFLETHAIKSSQITKQMSAG